MALFIVERVGTGFSVRSGENTLQAAASALVAEGWADAAALSAVYAEAMTGPTYASTAAGLAATVNGQGFAVDNGDGTVTVYRNSAGVAVAQRTLATTAALAASGGAALIGTASGGTVQDALFPERRTSSFRLAFGTNGHGLFVGGNKASFKGLVIGGGDAVEGEDGVRVNLSGHATWADLRPTKNYASIELAVNPTMATSVGTITAGGNTFTVTAGSPADGFWVGKKVYIGEGRYNVSAVAGSAVTVTNLDGSAVSWAATDTAAILKFCIVYGTGTCNVSGANVSRVSGDPFVIYFGDPTFNFKINGTLRSVTGMTEDSATLSTSIGTLTGATYEYWFDVQDQFAAFRLHATGAESVVGENLTVYTTYNGYRYEAQAGAAGKFRPLFFSTGQLDGGKRDQLALYPDGRVTLGGPSSKPVISIDPATSGSVNYFQVSAANTGGNPVIAARGSDANVGLAFDAKGTGFYRFTSNSFNNVAFDILANSGSDWVQVAGSTGRAFVVAAGGSANVDLQLDPKGDGSVRFGTWTSNADTAINGYVTIKDSAGNVRKLATIA